MILLAFLDLVIYTDHLSPQANPLQQGQGQSFDISGCFCDLLRLAAASVSCCSRSAGPTAKTGPGGATAPRHSVLGGNLILNGQENLFWPFPRHNFSFNKKNQGP